MQLFIVFIWLSELKKQIIQETVQALLCHYNSKSFILNKKNSLFSLEGLKHPAVKIKI